MICFRVLISGRVQGVGYRYSTREKAKTIGIVGWVRNLPNGQVEATIVGSPDQVDQIMMWFHEGPTAAKVITVEAEKGVPLQFESFEIRQ